MTTPAITRLPYAANAHLLTAWRRAASNPDLSRLFDLDQADITALSAADEAALEEWAHCRSPSPRRGRGCYSHVRDRPAEIRGLPAVDATLNRCDMPQSRPTKSPKANQPSRGVKPEIQQVSSLRPDSDRAHCTVTETLNRHVALQLMLLHLPASDIRFLCDVPEYFLKRIFDNLRLARGGERRTHKRHGGSSPGVWSLCYRPTTRMEAALFACDWVKVGLPFASRPDPTSLCHALQRYRHWGWGDARRA